MFRKLRSRFIKTTVLEELNVDGTTYRVVDKTGPFYKGRRALVFKKDGVVYIHSTIYTDKKIKLQPSMIICQNIIDLWGKRFGINNALCLGAAGCAMPRFISLAYPKSHTVGIEYVKEFVDIAKKYFLLNEIENQFELKLGDAFEYVKSKEIKNKFDAIFIDIFDKDTLPENLFSQEFLEDLYNVSSENAVLVFNLLTFSPSKAQKFAQSIKASFNIKAIVVKEGRTSLVLSKTDTEEKRKEFLSSLESLGTTVIC